MADEQELLRDLMNFKGSEEQTILRTLYIIQGDTKVLISMQAGLSARVESLERDIKEKHGKVDMEIDALSARVTKLESWRTAVYAMITVASLWAWLYHDRIVAALQGVGL